MRKFRNIVMMFALILSVSLAGCDNKGGGSTSIDNGVEVAHNTVQHTDKGAEVHSESGLSADQLAQIDAGLTQAFADGVASGWADNGKAYNYSMYKILIPKKPCVLSPESHTPSFTVSANNYDGSVYDQHNTKGKLPVSQQTDFDMYVKDGVGEIFAAEMVLTLNTEGSTVNGAQSVFTSFIVCPEASVLKNGTQYGAEHGITAHYDNDYFNETMTHSTKGHPILPKPQARGLVAGKPKASAKMTSPIINPVR